MSQLKLVLVGISACVLIAGCQTKGIYSAVGDAHIVDVSVHSSAKTLPPGVLPKVREGLKNKLSNYPKSGPAKCMTVAISDYHLKNPAMSLLVGDSNRMTGTVRIVDAASGVQDGTRQVAALDSYMMNGIIGAAQAAGQDAAKVEGVLTDTFERKVLEAAYGSEHTKKGVAAAPPAASAGSEKSKAPAVSPTSQGSAETPRCGNAPSV